MRNPLSCNSIRMSVYTRESLLQSGLSRRALSSFHRVLPQIYSDAEPSYLDRCTALTLWKPTAVLSHASAAWMWGLTEEPALVEATVPLGTQVRGPQWVRLHRRTVTKQARTNGLPVVPIEHCLIDVATGNEAARPRGVVRRRNWTRIGRYYGDLVCRRAKVIIEIDGREFHIEPEPFNNDRKRQNALIADGWRILRYSAATAMAHLEEVVDEDHCGGATASQESPCVSAHKSPRSVTSGPADPTCVHPGTRTKKPDPTEVESGFCREKRTRSPCRPCHRSDRQRALRPSRACLRRRPRW